MLTDGRTTDDGRTPDAGVTGILIAHLGAFGSGELKSKNMVSKYPLKCKKIKCYPNVELLKLKESKLIKI